MPNSGWLGNRLDSARPNDPLPLPPTNDDDLECTFRALAGPESGGVATTGLSPGRDFLWLSSGRGAVMGPGDVFPRPYVLMSFGWKRPRRTEFFSWSIVMSNARRL